MSLNFFKSTPQKTDATLQFNTVLDNLNEKRDVIPLNIDEFIQQENINLRSHQEFYKEPNTKDKIAPKSINKDDEQTKENTRILVNTLLELTKSMPEYKSKSVEYNEKITTALDQNKQTIQKIQSLHHSL